MNVVLKVFIEALVLAVTFVMLFAVTHAITMKMYGDLAMTNHRLLFAQVGIAAGLFHVLCEWFGVNGWYCQNR